MDCKSNLNGITVFPADSMITVKHWYGAQPLIPYIILKTKGPDERISTQKWTEVCAYYQAKGGERFLWMGNFIDSARYDPKLKTKLVKPGTILKCGTQFYCDDVKVEKCLPPEITSLVIRNIVFDVGSSKVMTVNDNNMLLLVKYLNDFPSFNIRIEGHTDSDGSQQFNQELSLKRAMAVKSWLEERGVASKQISTAGFGKTRPLGSENTPEHKALNRRVEIKFIKP
jgi:outer membrane protein OmpA-like peptidoglycan-associated protein